MNAGIGGQEVQFRLEGTKGAERMSSGATGWRVSLTEDNTRVYPRARGAADRADGPYRTRLPATSRTYIDFRLPSILGRHGVSRILEPEMSDDERKAFRRSAEKLKNALRLEQSSPPF